MDQTYDVSKLVAFKSISLLQRTLFRLLLPFEFVRVCFETLQMLVVRKNPLHDGKRKLSGKKALAISDEFCF